MGTGYQLFHFFVNTGQELWSCFNFLLTQNARGGGVEKDRQEQGERLTGKAAE